MQATRKIVRTYLITAAYVVMFCFIAIIALIGIFIVSGMSIGVFSFILDYKTEIALIPFGIFLALLAYKAYRVIKRVDNPWQTVRENLKPNLIIISSIAFIIYAGMVLFAARYPTEYDRCDFYNKELGGESRNTKGASTRFTCVAYE